MTKSRAAKRRPVQRVPVDTETIYSDPPVEAVPAEPTFGEQLIEALEANAVEPDEACIGDPSHQYHSHDDDPEDGETPVRMIPDVEDSPPEVSVENVDRYIPEAFALRAEFEKLDFKAECTGEATRSETDPLTLLEADETVLATSDKGDAVVYVTSYGRKFAIDPDGWVSQSCGPDLCIPALGEEKEPETESA